MRLSLVFLAFLCACEPAPDGASAEALPDDELPAPAAFTLVASHAIGGGVLVLTATGVSPGASVRFAVSSQGIGPGACPPVLAGACLGIRAPANLLPTVVVANGLGVATYNYTVSPLLVGGYVAAQAAQVTGGVRLSNAVDRKVGPTGTIVSPTADTDGDGYSVDAGDCADFDPRIFPAQTDTVGEFHDQNCDNLDGVDADRDQVASIASGGTDCDDSSPLTYPGAWEVCDHEDNNCDGLIPALQTWANPGGPGIGGPSDTWGMLYNATTDQRIDRLRFHGRAYNNTWADTLRVYDSAGAGQPFTLAHTFGQATLEGPVAPYNWFVHSNLNLTLLAGHRYIFEIEGNGFLRVFTASAPVTPVVWPWGSVTRGWSSQNILPAVVPSAPANGNSMEWQLLTVFEFDGDGDGLYVCEDCDDTNAAIGACVP